MADIIKPYQLLIKRAAQALTDNNLLTFTGVDLSTLEYVEDYTGQIPTAAEVQAKIDEMMPDFAMALLRENRDKMLADTDWWSGGDLTMTAEQTAYRQALRDLPANTTGAAVGLDGRLTGVTWPTKPE
jgi:hypothetical protein